MTTWIVLLLAAAAVERPASMNEAAVVALAKAYNEHPHYYEYGGVITRMPDGTFNPSVPVTIGHASNMDIDEDYEAYEGHYPIVAAYHTHPCLQGYIPSKFSPTDLHTARESGRPAYILDECTGDVHRWQLGDGYDPPPEHKDFIEIIIGGPDQLSSGTIVGHVPVDGKPFSLTEPVNPTTGSWDQENLKRNDKADCHDNPVFVAPDGNLVQCP